MTEMPGIEALLLPISIGPAWRRTMATDGVNGPIRPSVAEELDFQGLSGIHHLGLAEPLAVFGDNPLDRIAVREANRPGGGLLAVTHLDDAETS